jgi:hypothetical protein
VFVGEERVAALERHFFCAVDHAPGRHRHLPRVDIKVGEHMSSRTPFRLVLLDGSFFLVAHAALTENEGRRAHPFTSP